MAALRPLHCKVSRMLSARSRLLAFVVSMVGLGLTAVSQSQRAVVREPQYQFNDSHVHLTNYIQQGPSLRDFLKIMGTTTGRSVLFGIPLQQEWSHRVSGDDAPTYYLQTDAPLYYYSFTDAAIAMAYLSLSPEERARFDPMITGFNPADMYAADHIRRFPDDQLKTEGRHEAQRQTAFPSTACSAHGEILRA